MPVNRNALIRYRTIDTCLQNRYRKWTLDDLIEACSEALYEYEGIDKGVSRRTVQADLQMMRSDKLGYCAPIVVVDRKYYTYADPEYSITNSPLTSQDLDMLSASVALLRQFKGFSHFRALEGMVQKLEAHIHAEKNQASPVIDFEKNENLKGLEYLDVLYQAIIRQRAISVQYQSFRARQASTFDFHPYLLKEYRNRWFVLGVRQGHDAILNLAIDRIQELGPSDRAYQAPDPTFEAATYFKDTIGVSVSPTLKPERVVLYVYYPHAPYVLTKPFHASQKLIDRDHYGVTIALDVQHNFELEKAILGFGNGIKVLAPTKLRRVIRERLTDAIDRYETEMTTASLQRATQKLTHKGFSVLSAVYTKREIRKIGRMLHTFMQARSSKTFSQRRLLQVVPDLKPLLFNNNLQCIVRAIDDQAFLCKAIFFDKTTDSNWYVTWHQDLSIHVAQKIDTEGFYGWTVRDGMIGVCPPLEVARQTFTVRVHLDDTNAANGGLKVIPGSHNKILSDEEIQLITTNSFPVACDVPAGGVHLMKPLLLHASSKTQSPRWRRIIHLEFTSCILPNGLTWAEREVWA